MLPIKTCPAVPVLEAILEELRAVRSELQEKNRQIRRKSTVSEQVKLLLKEFPHPDWSSEELARKIGNGCSGAAVRQTAIWKSYRKMQRTQHTECTYKDFVTDDIY
ncbi:hypothetical protein FACS189427_07710 [Planctomycetales bacterium]|nr:hypothetical protein FACS189427_07710 [Planctomycetales bacterium]